MLRYKVILIQFFLLQSTLFLLNNLTFRSTDVFNNLTFGTTNLFNNLTPSDVDYEIIVFYMQNEIHFNNQDIQKTAVEWKVLTKIKLLYLYTTVRNVVDI